MSCRIFTMIMGFGAVVLALGSGVNCGSSSPTTPASLPVSVEGLDGSSDVAVDSSFSYSFTKAVDPSTVSTSTYFIVATPSTNIAVGIKAVVDTSICNASNALSVSVSYNAFTLKATLDPASNLSEGTSYSLCLSTDIDYADGTSFEGYMVTFRTSGTAAAPSCTAPSCSDIRTPILASNATGVRPSTSFTTVTLPEFSSCTATPTLSVTGLPSSLSFDATTRALALSSGSTTIASTEATSAITITYTATIGSTTAASVECTLNDMDGDTLIDHTEYKYGAVPLASNASGWIWLNPGTKLLNRPKSGSNELISTGITKAAEGLDLNDATDASADFDGDGDTNLAEITAGTNIFVAESTGTFASAVNYSVNTFPIGIVSEDFDGDGDHDLAVGSLIDDNVLVLLGNGSGTFTNGNTYTVSAGPVHMTSADFDADGDQDIVIAHSESGSGPLSVLLGGGNGTFGTPTTYSMGAGTIPVPADFDGDGDIDIAVNDSASDVIAIRLGAGNGTFGSAVTYAASQDPLFISSADFDADGDLDLAVSNQTGNKVSIFLGGGDGSFGSATHYDVGTKPQGIAAADFDNDGNLDLVVVHSTSDNVMILDGQGDGTFGSPSTIATGIDGVPVFTADFDGDNDIDIAVGDNAGNQVSIFKNDGTGAFASAVSYATGQGPQGVIAVDLDNDGDLDLATTNLSSNTISISLNQ